MSVDTIRARATKQLSVMVAHKYVLKRENDLKQKHFSQETLQELINAYSCIINTKCMLIAPIYL